MRMENEFGKMERERARNNFFCLERKRIFEQREKEKKRRILATEDTEILFFTKR